MTNQENDRSGPEFRELPSIKLWTAVATAEGVSRQEFAQILTEVSRDTQFSFFGFYVETSAESIDYHFSRYPRQKYGIQSIDQCQKAVDILRPKLLTATRSPSVMVNDYLRDIADGFDFRVLLGLVEGYDKNQVTHTENEVASRLGDGLKIVPATIHTVREIGIYTEPAIWIKGKKSDLPKVYRLANAFKQERFTVEDLLEETAHVVEPPCCTSPDPQ